MIDKPVDLRDALQELAKHEEELTKQVYIEGDTLVINVEYEYEIDLDRCDTHAKILSWVSHLTEKTWMNMDVLDRFIHLAARHHGLEIHQA